MKKHFIGLVLLAATCSTNAQDFNTHYVDGNELYRSLKANEFQALAYIVGVFDAVQILQYHLSARERMFCVPQNVTREQLGDIIKLQLEADPATRHLDAAILVLRGLMETFPCPGN